MTYLDDIWRHRQPLA